MDMREAADRLVVATDARRIELGKKWKQVYTEAGVTHQTLNRWRNGHPVALLTERALERALEWAPGAREAIVAGREPTPLDEAPSDTLHISPTLEQELELAARLMAAQVQALGLSPEEAEEAWRRAQEAVTQSHLASPESTPEAHPEASRRHHAG
jgi:hypothetical protein